MANFKISKRIFGFTMIEILVVITIISVITGLTLSKYNTFNQEQSLRNSAKSLVDVFELAKKKAISSDLYQNCSNFTGYQVTVNANTYVMYFSCNSVNQTVQNYSFSNHISVVTGTGTLSFPPMGSGINLTINSVRIKNSTINKCVDISISPIGIFTITNSLISC